MAILRPFRALRPLPEKALQVSAVPYDVVNREEAAALAQGNPLSFLHVSRPEIDLAADIDVHSAPVYDQARAALKKLQHDCPLVQDPTPLLYVYRLRQGAHEQTGIAATFSVNEYNRGIIKRHERTRRDKEDDRTRHLLALGAQTGPSFLAYRDQTEINQLVVHTVTQKPLFDFMALDGVKHTVWSVSETTPWVEAFAKIPALYIADGHHRTASASRAHAELSGQKPADQEGAAHAFFLAVAFPESQLRILPYHRVVRDLAGNTSAQFLEKLGESFVLRENASAEPARGEFSMYLGGRWIGLKPKAAPPASAIAALDVSVLQDRVLAPLLGILDPRTDQRIDFVGGIRGTGELERVVNAGRAAVAFAVHPTTLDDLMRIADADEIMPPKSTWFEPKLRDGLLSHVIV